MIDPSLDLSVEIEKPNGRQFIYEARGHAPGSEVPTDIQFSTKRMEGFERGSFVLRRRIDLEWPDIELFDTVRFVANDGFIAYEGRVAAMPRSLDADGHQIVIECVGWMAHARDKPFREIFIDRDIGHWAGPTLNRRSTIIVSGYSYAAYSTDVAQGGTAGAALTASTTRLNITNGPTRRDLSEFWYDSGGIPLGRLYYEYLGTGGSAPDWHTTASLSTDDAHSGFLFGTDHANAAGPVGAYVTTANAAVYYWAAFQAYFNAVFTGDGQWSHSWRNPAVYGNHGLATHGADPQGFYVSDMIRNICGRFCPKLSTAGVLDTTYVVSHAAFRELTDPYDAWLELNKYHLWELAVWEGPTLHFSGIDATDYDWDVRLDDPGVTVDLQGDTTADLCNGFAITFQNVLTGTTDVVTPDDSNSLRDLSPTNPVNMAGLDVWKLKTLSSPAALADAIQIGSIAMNEFNSPKSPGSIALRGYVRDRQGARRPGFAVRASETMAITTHPNDRPRIISETTWNHSTKTLTVATDTEARYLDAFIDRLASAIQASGTAL